MPSVLRVESVEYRWPKDQANTLDIPEFAIDVGQDTFLMGPSGSGKSTLLNLVSGVITPNSGSIFIRDIDIAQPAATARDRIRADAIGYIFQQFNLIPYLSALENVLLPCQFSQTRRARSVNRAQSPHENAMSLLNGFFGDHPPNFNKPVTNLSVGQQQRVAAARALIGAPSLIIADEPTSALDQEAKGRFMELLLSECDQQGSTLLFVSHDPDLAKHFPKSVKMSEINKIERP